MTTPPILQRMRGALAAVWLKSRDRMFERVGLLDSAAMRLLEGELPESDRREAERAAHQLAGTCGTFGFLECTDLAREAERALAGTEPIGPSQTLRLAEIAVAIRARLSAGLPEAADSAPSAGAVTTAGLVKEHAPAGDEGTQELVLALDDDPAALELLAALLPSAGYRLLTTTASDAFLQALADRAPSLVILDVDMPGLTGLEMCQRLRADARWVALPVLFLTARTDATSVAQLFDAGADDYVSKPFTGPELVSRIRNRLQRSRLPRAGASTLSPTTDVAVVDDDLVLADLLVHSLSTAGFSTSVHRDGPSALRALTSRDGAPPAVRARVIVLDVGLPGMDGLTVLRSLARQGITAQSRVVMLTARSSEDEVMQALELGAVDHVAKPFSVPILLHRIRQAFQSARSDA